MCVEVLLCFCLFSLCVQRVSSKLGRKKKGKQGVTKSFPNIKKILFFSWGEPWP
jgi:hypothetical protein